jgi:hypothetical protein
MRCCRMSCYGKIEIGTFKYMRLSILQGLSHVPHPDPRVVKNLGQGRTRPTKLPITSPQMVGKREQRGHNKKKVSYMGRLLYPAPTQREGDKEEPFQATSPTPTPAERQKRGKSQKVS